MTKQLNIFLENRPGRLESVAEALAKAKINVMAFTIQDRGDFGLTKLLVNKPDEAHLLLADKGYACALKDILAVSIKDKPGNLHKLTQVLLKHNINIIDAHGFVQEPSREGICCLEVNLKDLKSAKAMLAKEGFKVLEEDELYEL